MPYMYIADTEEAATTLLAEFELPTLPGCCRWRTDGCDMSEVRRIVLHIACTFNHTCCSTRFILECPALPARLFLEADGDGPSSPITPPAVL